MKNECLKLSSRENEVLALLNDRFGYRQNLSAHIGIQELETILLSAWKEPSTELHNLGVPKYAIAKMIFKHLGMSGFVSQFQSQQRRDYVCWNGDLS